MDASNGSKDEAASTEPNKGIEQEAIPLGFADARYLAALAQLQIQDPKPADLPARIAILREALGRLKREENANLWAAMQYDLAVCLRELPDADGQDAAQARDAFAASLLVYDERDSPQFWAAAQMGLGAATAASAAPDDTDAVQKARAAFRAALRVYDRKRFPQTWQALQENLAKLDGTEDPPEIRYFRQIATAIDSKEDPEAYARALARLGSLWRDNPNGRRADNLENALDAFGRARSALLNTPSDELRARITRDLAGIYQMRLRGDRAENIGSAIRLLEEALNVFTREKYPKEYAETQHNLGMAYLRSLDSDRAANTRRASEAFQQAASVFEANPELGSPARSYLELSHIYFERESGDRKKDLELAIQYGQAAADDLSQSNDTATHAGALANMGTMLMERKGPGDIERAIGALEQARTMREGEQPASARAQDLKTRDLIVVLNSLSLAYRQRTAGDSASNRQRALEIGSEALRLATPALNATLSLVCAMNLGELLAEDGEDAKAYDTFLQARDAADLLYGTALTPESRRAHIGNVAEVAAKLVDMAMRKTPPSPTNALEHSEHARARVLREEAAGAERSDEAKIPTELRLLESGSAKRLDQYRRLIEITQPGDIRSGFIRQAEKYRWYSHASRVEVRRLVDGTEPPAWERIQHWLSQQKLETAIVEYCSLPDRLLAFVAKKGFSEPVVREIPLRLKDIQNLAGRHSAEMRKVPASSAPETWLTEAAPLLEGVAADVKGSDLLYFVPDRDIYRLPLHAMTIGGKPLIEGYAVAYAPSIALLMSEPKGTSAATGEMLVVGNPSGDLHGAELEARAVAKRFGVKPLIGPEATLDSVRASLSQSPAAHIATHAFFESRDPLESGLLMAGGEVLTVRDILLLERTPPIVVLSACETGVQEVGPGNDTNGLPRAFLAGGTSTLVQSLWNVSDVSTGSLINSFYQRMEVKATVPEALRGAMVEERSRNSHSFYWGPFVVFGRGTS